jgi:hypothetical protein
MIKKSGAFLLAILYCITVTGFALNLHYCGQLLSSVNINAAAKNCGMHTAKAMKCCKDKTIEVKVKDAHQNAADSFFTKAKGFNIVKSTFLTTVSLDGPPVNNRALGLSFAKAPPGNIPPYLKNCTFRI